jgi:hypothetical protein
MTEIQTNRKLAQRAKLITRLAKWQELKRQIDWDLRQPVNRGNQYSKLFEKSRLLGYKIEELEEKLNQ